jgi:outer membrane protein TolC
MTRKACVLLSVLTILIQPVFSQNKVWTIKACIDSAVKNNILSSTANNPSSSDSEELYQNNNPSFSKTKAADPYQQDNVYAMETGLQSVTDAEEQHLLNRNKLNQMDFETAKNQLTLKVLDGYLRVLFDLEQIDLLNKQILASQQQLKQAEELVKLGKQSKHQLLQIELQLGNDKMSLINAVGDLSYDQITLMQIINVPLAVDFEVQKISPAILENLIHNKPEDALLIQQEAKDDIGGKPLAVNKNELQLQQKKKVALRKAIEGVYANLQELQKKYDEALENFKLVENAYKNVQSDFEAGLVSAVDLEIEKTSFQTAQSDLLQAKYQLILNKETLALYEKGSVTL